MSPTEEGRGFSAKRMLEKKKITPCNRPRVSDLGGEMWKIASEGGGFVGAWSLTQGKYTAAVMREMCHARL